MKVRLRRAKKVSASSHQAQSSVTDTVYGLVRQKAHRMAMEAGQSHFKRWEQFV